jgi:hypothetical protein
MERFDDGIIISRITDILRRPLMRLDCYGVCLAVEKIFIPTDWPQKRIGKEDMAKFVSLCSPIASCREGSKQAEQTSLLFLED